MSISESLGQRRTVSLPQGTIAYRERGAGDPVVLSHGYITNGDLWRKVVPLLADRYRCITPDWPFGAHELPMEPWADLTPTGLASLMDDFMAELGLDEVTFVGCELGGALAQIMAAHRPQRIGRLVLTSCDAFDNYPPKIFKPLRYATYVPGVPLLLANLLRPRRLHMLPIGYGWLCKRPFPPEISRSYLRPLQTDRKVRRDASKVLRETKPSYMIEATERLRHFTPPTLIAWAEEDKVFPFEHGERLAQLMPNARLVAVPDSYTQVPEDQPELLASALVEFLREQEVPSPA